MNEIEMNEMLKKLEDLNRIAELPALYIADYFIDLRNEVDLFAVSKLLNLKNTDQQQEKNDLNEKWQQIISKID
jgi:hypothetical protein